MPVDSTVVELELAAGSVELIVSAVELVAPELVMSSSVVEPPELAVFSAVLSSPLVFDVPFVDPSIALPLHAHASNTAMALRRDMGEG